jgi:hypothetical protein
MLDRDAELRAFKEINLSVIAASFGYEMVKKKSSPHSVMMRNGSDKILIANSGGHYVFCTVSGAHDASGTAIDFIQNVVERGCSLGRVRQLLRPFLSGGHVASIQQQHAPQIALEIRPSELDLLAVAARYSELEPLAEPNAFLTQTRGIPHELLVSDRLRGRIRFCPRRGTVAFPHMGSPTTDPKDRDRCLTGYEIKGPGLSLFSKGGRKGLFMSAGMPGDKQLVVSEAGLDAISYLVVRGDNGTRVCSTAGKLNPLQPALLRSAIERLGEGEVVAAFDQDAAGTELTERLAEIAASHSRDSIVFKDDRPLAPGADWNQVVMEEAIRAGRTLETGKKNGPSFGR